MGMALLPYMGHLGQKWKTGCNFQLPDPIFKTKGSWDAESWEDSNNFQIKQ